MDRKYLSTITHSVRLGLFIYSCSGTVLEADVVTDWNQATIEAIRAAPAASNPGDSTRIFAMVHTAVYDAVNSVTKTNNPYHSQYNAAENTSMEAAAAQAAHDVLAHLFPSQAASFDSLLTNHMMAISNWPAKGNGMTVGAQSAASIINLRSNDGAQNSTFYTTTNAPGHWAPDPLHPNQSAWGPNWGNVTPWTVPNSGTYAPSAPPSLTSQAYTDSFNQVKDLGALNSTTRTADQTEIGIFWGYDRATLGPPPILYNQIVKEVADLKGNTLEQNARLFAMANVAMADASITAWDAKFEHDFWRPITAIRDADLDGNDLTIADANWQPLGAPGDPTVPGSDFTPPFPAYISGHATMGAAAFTTLENFYGSDEIGTDLVISSDELPGVTRTYNYFSEMTDENAWSRIYLGVHWDFDATVGIDVGNGVADYVSTTAFAQVPEPSSLVLLGLVSTIFFATKRNRHAKS